MRTCMDPGIFARVVDGPSPTVGKSPDNFLVLNLFYSGAQYLFQRNYNFSRVQAVGGGGGGVKMSGGQPFPR